MENTPNIPEPPENDPEKAEKKDGKKKKKRAEALGAFAVEPKPRTHEQKPEGKTDNQKELPGEQAKEPTAVEAPMDGLSEQEVVQVRQSLAAERQEELSGDIPVSDEQQAALDAVNDFHQRMVEGQAADEAYADTLKDLGVEAEENTGTDIEQPSLTTATEAPRELREEPVSINRPTRQDTRPRFMTPTATESWPTGGFGLYSQNAIANPTPQAAYKPEYVPLRDEFLLRNFPGGIVGYLMGRRRGRAKTEKKLLPVQKKLEAQVKNLKQDIINKENHIRRVVAERPPKSPATNVLKMNEKLPHESEPITLPEARPAAVPLPVPERLGHMIVGVERQPKARVEKPLKAAESPNAARDVKRVETMSRAELLQASEKVVVEGSTLRQIYETRLIGERGMRRLLKEHLAGGDVKKALQREIVEREIDFERDPVMRDRLPQETVQTSVTNLQSLLQKTQSDKDTEEVAFYRARAAYESTQQQAEDRKRKIVDVSLYGTILVLVAVIAILYLSRR